MMCVHVEAVQTHLPTELVAPLPELLHARASRCALSFSLLLIHQRKLVPPKKRAPRLVARKGRATATLFRHSAATHLSAAVRSINLPASCSASF